MSKGVRRSVRIRGPVQKLLAHVKNDVEVCGRVRVCWAWEVPKVVTLHHPSILDLALLDEDVDSIRARVHEGHGTHHFAFVLHPAAAAGSGLELVNSILIGVDVGRLDRNVFMQWAGILLKPDIDVATNDSFQGEVAVPPNTCVQKNYLGADFRVLPYPTFAAIGVADHVGEPCKAGMLAFSGLEIQAMVTPSGTLPHSLEELLIQEVACLGAACGRRRWRRSCGWRGTAAKRGVGGEHACHHLEALPAEPLIGFHVQDIVCAVIRHRCANDRPSGEAEEQQHLHGQHCTKTIQPCHRTC
mmetsp:Transcript_46485/g.122788  ORF Transcript_46485/g.122788 Transcript_46485/m.122788 type:complete len:300 (+) Transcript_46485:1769-2668(+)